MLWKKLYGLDAVYSRKTLLGLVRSSLALLIISIAFFALSLTPGNSLSVSSASGILPLLIAATALVLSLGWFSGNAAKVVYVRRLLKGRRYLADDPARSTYIDKAAVNEELDKVDDVRMIAEGPGWRLYDAVFDVMRHGRHGRYKAAEVYYTVLEADLKKQVPHMLFDSVSAKKKQFKNIYSRAQKLSPGPAFETAFDTYVPKYYQIDALSVITPEVMEAMLAVRDYDIELLDNRLLCYAPLLPAKELENFRLRCLGLQRHLDDNLRAYRDDRVRPGRRGEVSGFGRQLLKNPFRNLPAAIAAALILAALGLISILSANPDIIFSRFSLLAAAVLVATIADMVILKRKNSRREAIFLTAQTEMAKMRRPKD